MSQLLRTNRLHLKPMQRDDLDDLARLWADPEVMRFIWFNTIDETAAAETVRQAVSHWETHGWGMWTVRRSDGSFVGEVGAVTAPNTTLFEIDFGFTLAQAAWGQGYATEAAAAALDDLWNRCGVTAVDATVMLGNVASANTLAKLGFVEERTVDLHGSPHRLWHHRGQLLDR